MLVVGLLLCAASATGAERSHRDPAVRRGDGLMRDRKFAEALAELEQILEEDGASGGMLMRAGIAQSMLSDFSEARTLLEGALALSSARDRPRVLLNLAILDLRQDELDEAEKWLGMLLGESPGHPQANYYMARVWERRGDNEKALSFYISEINNNGSYGGAWDRYYRLKTEMSQTGEKSRFSLIVVNASCLMVAAAAFVIARIRRQGAL